LNRFQITILGGIADVDEAEPSMYSDWLEGDQGLIALLRHSLVQQNHLLTHQVMELIRERKLFELQGNVLFIDPSICAALDDTTFAHLLHSIPAPELQEVSIYFNGCYALGPASVRSALEWCPTALFPSLQDCPQLYEGEIRLRDGRSLVHKALLQRCPVLHAELEKGLTLRRSEWAIVDHYLRMGNCKGAEQSISAFKAFSSIGSTELMESYGKELCETFLEDCWKFPITSERVLYAIDLTRLSIQWRLQTLYDSLAAYLSHCIGESFEFGEVATPGELVEGELLLLRQILDVLPTFYLSALSEELPCEKSPYKVIHKSRLEERLYIVYWLKRNAPNLDTFCIDPLQTRSQMERQMQLLTEHFPEMRIVRATHGCLVFDKYSMRTCLIGTAFSTDFQDTKEQKQGKSS
ncbi:MAG: hypothetical protein KDK78_08905, partial [Chlamydiia bacterium]|nr:hypothetical protein [Chlamydiia bacterium]